jgi:hypothetical protein
MCAFIACAAISLFYLGVDFICGGRIRAYEVIECQEVLQEVVNVEAGSGK